MRYIIHIGMTARDGRVDYWPVDGEVGSFNKQFVERVDHATVVDERVDVPRKLFVIEQVQPAFTDRCVRLYTPPANHTDNRWIKTHTKHSRANLMLMRQMSTVWLHQCRQSELGITLINQICQVAPICTLAQAHKNKFIHTKMFSSDHHWVRSTLAKSKG